MLFGVPVSAGNDPWPLSLVGNCYLVVAPSNQRN
jgi:hypothetical protein